MVNQDGYCRDERLSRRTTASNGPASNDTPWGTDQFQGDHAKVVAGILSKGLDPRFVVHVGDLVHDGGTQGAWNAQFFWPAQPLLDIAPLFPCLGNHEYSGDSGANYKAYFTLPDQYPVGDPKNERWYHFDYADCRFICLDVNIVTDFDQPSDPQRQWLTSKLSEASQQRKRVFVWFHQPAFSTGGDRDYAWNVKRDLVPKFAQYAVDMVFNGHDHFYERNVKQGVTYIVTGGAGAPLNRDLWWYTNPPDDTDPKCQCEAREGWFHYCRLAVSPTDIGLTAIHDSTVPLDILGEAERAKTFGLGEGVSWFYNDSGQDLGTAWKDPGYSHTWPIANAPLGFGEGQTPQLQRGYVTYYFRKEGVSINGFADAEQIAIKLRCDDGCVVYANGQEAFRHNMPVDSVNWQTKAPYSVGEEVGDSWMENLRSFNRYIVPKGLFTATNNTIAIEAHQSEKDMAKPAAQRDLNIDVGLWTWY